MEINYNLVPLLGSSVCRLDAQRMKQLQSPQIYKAIDQMGEMSAKAMMIPRPLTSSERIIHNPDHTLYLMWEPCDDGRLVESDLSPNTPFSNKSKFLGMLKMGRKQLFFYDRAMQTYHGKVLCLLDFYVHFTRQREGIGKHLFDFMLQSEKVSAGEIALDNPTVTLLAFMSKHYGLADPIWQNTNFVVFPEFFTEASKKVARDVDAVDGWQRKDAPQELGTGATATRWLGALGRDTASKERHAMSAAWGADLSTEGTMANRAQMCRQRKQHILGSNPLW